MKTGRKYGEKEKIQILIKSLIFRTLQIYIFSFYAFLFFVSLADAECLFAHTKVLKNIPQHLIRLNCSAHDFSQVIKTLTKVL